MNEEIDQLEIDKLSDLIASIVAGKQVNLNSDAGVRQFAEQIVNKFYNEQSGEKLNYLEMQLNRIKNLIKYYQDKCDELLKDAADILNINENVHPRQYDILFDCLMNDGVYGDISDCLAKIDKINNKNKSA